MQLELLQNLIFAILNRLGVKHFPMTPRILRKSFSGNNVDKIISSYLPGENAKFVELGAYDGIVQSNTKYFEFYKGWSGVLVEPYLPNFVACRKNRSKKNYYYNGACVSFHFPKDYVNMKYADLMTISLDSNNQIESINNHLKDAKNNLNLGQDNAEFCAKAISLNEILIEARMPNLIDFLSLDVEGMELEVLSGLNHQQFRFKYICIESRDLEESKSFLSLFSYLYLEPLSHRDHLFVDSAYSNSEEFFQSRVIADKNE